MAILKRDIQYPLKQHFCPMLKKKKSHLYLTVSVKLVRLISSLTFILRKIYVREMRRVTS